MPPIFTIGHSNHTSNGLIEMLTANNIDVVVDVRSAPYSRYVPHFNKSNLQLTLLEKGFKYIFMGDMIGGKPSEHTFYDHLGNVMYDKIAVTDHFQVGLDRLEKGISAGWHIALLCAEEDPQKCHRHHLVARQLEYNKKIPVVHIRADLSTIRAKELFDTSSDKQLGLFA